MLEGLLGVALVLMWLLSSWVLNRVFNEFGRSIVLDDLGEYGALYETMGIEGVRALFQAGRHESDQFLRIQDASGSVLLSVSHPNHPELVWPVLNGETPPVDRSTTWVQHKSHDGVTLTIGGRRLPNGGQIWFGRSNEADLAAIAQVHRLLAFGIGVTAVLSVGPIFWFARQVLRPVRQLIRNARRLVRSGPTLQRLEGSHAIPELQELSDAFNHGLEQVRSVSEELEAANDQLAHELRTPLARIRGNVEKILALSYSHGVRDNAARAISEIERATRLIQAILTTRAGETRTLRLHLGSVDLNSLAEVAYDLYSAVAEEKGLALSFSPSKSTVRAWGDHERLQQALCCLLDNAIAYTPRGGKIDIQIRADDRFGWVTVADTGPGLSDADPERIWGRFVRGSAASAAASGIGLGLSVVRSIAVAHEGEAGARNRPSGGAEFWLRIPLQEAAARESPG